MAWTELTRRQHDRAGDRYASDLTDAEWAVIVPLLPARKTTGRPRTTGMRDVVDAILHIATTGCQWRMLPSDFPPVSTVRGYFHAWRNDGLLDDLNRRLVEIARLSEGRAAQPTSRTSWPPLAARAGPATLPAAMASSAAVKSSDGRA